MNRLSRGSVSTVSGDRPLGFAMADTFRLVVVALLVMTLPLLQKLGYCSVP
jgi:hypothetical protein